MREFIFGGISTKEFGVHVSGEDSFAVPAPRTTSQTIAGRSGDLLIWDGSYENITIDYPCAILRNFEDNYNAFAAFLMSKAGYQRLEDSYHPSFYRMASVADGLDPTMYALNRNGTFTVSFNCKPWKYLAAGDTAVTIETETTIENPTRYESRPLLRVYPTADAETLITINDINTILITATDAVEYIDIDCEIGECYCGSVNANGYVVFSTTGDDDLPALAAGSNILTLDNAAAQVSMYPRWRTI